MLDPSKSHDTRTIHLHTPDGLWLRACFGLTHQCKNLYNTGNHIVRQVVSAYAHDAEKDVYRLKAELHPAQTAVIEHLNRCIDGVNQKRQEKHPAKVAKALAAGKDEPELKLVPRLEAEVKSPFRSVLDVTVLDNALKAWSNERGDVVYRRLPGAVAQQVVNRLVEAYKGFSSALAQFKLDPSGMTGRPRMPGYLEKNERFVLEVPFAQINGTIPEPKEKRVPENDFVPDASYLSADMLRAFYDYNMADAIIAACRKRGWKEFQPQHLRIVPMQRGVRIEAVVRIPNPYPEGSFLFNLVHGHANELKALKNDRKRDEWLLAHLGGLSADKLPSIAGMDLGKSNLASVAYTTGNRAAVHIGGRFTANMEDFTRRIAERVSALTPERAKHLQAMKLELQKQGEKLDKPEHIELCSLLKSIYEDDEVRRLMGKKDRWSDDYLHKLSTRLVRDCVARHVDVIVIGRNKGWKQEVNMGTEQNRTFCQIAHARLIELIRYKAEAYGIGVVTTEESYTSKTSFVNNDELECYANKTRDAAASTLPVKRTGKRSSVDRNWFHHKNRDDRWKWVHADVNGAFNIIRKVFRSFAYPFHSMRNGGTGLTLKFTLYRVSPRLGVTPLSLASA